MRKEPVDLAGTLFDVLLTELENFQDGTIAKRVNGEAVPMPGIPIQDSDYHIVEVEYEEGEDAVYLLRSDGTTWMVTAVEVSSDYDRAGRNPQHMEYSLTDSDRLDARANSHALEREQPPTQP